VRSFLICILAAAVAACGTTGINENPTQSASTKPAPVPTYEAAPAYVPAPPPPPSPPPAAPAPQPIIVPHSSAVPLSGSKAGLYTVQTPVTPSVGNNQFPTFEENPVKRAIDDPVSTFSIDVDTASYALMRRDLQGGRLPDPDSIRIEELINYFPYEYSTNSNESAPFSTSVTVLPTPWNDGTRLMHIGLQGYEPPIAERPDANITLLIDTSGSMRSEDKLPLLIRSFLLFLDSLEPQDRVSIVTYAGSTGVALEPTPVAERETIELALRALTSGGGTAGGAGLNLAYAQAEAGFLEGGINRIFLATDGDFNIGPSSPKAMEDLITEKRKTGVFLSVLGFGRNNRNDRIMQTLAQKGKGEWYRSFYRHAFRGAKGASRRYRSGASSHRF